LVRDGSADSQSGTDVSEQETEGEDADIEALPKPGFYLTNNHNEDSMQS
jgi:hypothetical protein